MRGNLCGPLGRGIDNGDKLNVLGLKKFLGVEVSEISHTDDGAAQRGIGRRFHGAMVGGRRRPGNSIPQSVYRIKKYRRLADMPELLFEVENMPLPVGGRPKPGEGLQEGWLVRPVR